MKQQIPSLLAGLMVAFILVVAVIRDPAWYRDLIPGALYLTCWIISRYRSFFPFLQLMCGLVAAIAVWPVIPSGGIILVWLFFGIFLLQNIGMRFGDEWYIFILFVGMTIFTAALLYLVPHTITVAGGVIAGAGCVLVGVQLALFRLSREFRGVYQ